MKKFFEPVALVVLVSLILWNNPKLFSSEPLFDEKARENHSIVSIEYQPSPQPQQPITNFRETVQRTGNAAFSVAKLQPKKIWFEPAFNLGIHGASKASPSVDRDGIYLGSDAGAFVHWNWNGEKQWSWWIPAHDRGIHATASVDQTAVYFGAYNGKFYKVDKISGRPVWTSQLCHTIGASPLLTPDALYVVCETFDPADGFLVKLDPRTGRTIWRSGFLGEQSHSSPTLSIDQKTIFLGANNKQFFAFNAEDGSLRWSITMTGEIKGTAAISGSELCFTSWAEGLTCVNSASGEKTYNYPLPGFLQSSLAIDSERRAYLTDTGAGLHALDLNRKMRLWKTIGSGEHHLGSSTVLSDRYIVGVCGDQQWCVWDAKNGKVVFRNQSGARLSGAPAVFENKIVLSFDHPKGVEAWSF